MSARLGPALAFYLLVAAPQASEVKIATFNVNYRNEKVAETVQLIEKHDPDVILLQETTPAFEKAAARHFSDAYKHTWYSNDEHPAGGYGVVSKLPQQNKTFLKKTKGVFGTQVVDIKIGDTAIRLVNIHLNPARMPASGRRADALHSMLTNNPIQVAEIESITSRVDVNTPTVIAGDLNSFASMGAYKTLTRLKGFTDAHLSIEPKANSITTWKGRLKDQTVHRRLDYVFHNRFFEAKAFEVVANELSDHSLLVCTLRLQSVGKKNGMNR
jgi:endonuclease/exonuclease/phosphatase family metal-dependent hydrolase